MGLEAAFRVPESAFGKADGASVRVHVSQGGQAGENFTKMCKILFDDDGERNMLLSR